MKSAKNKRQLTLLTLVLALGVAVYLNWQYAKDTTQLLTIESVSAVNATTSDVAIETSQDSGGVLEALPDKNYGDAQLVNTSEAGGYFEQARLTRTKTRDEALDKLQKSLKSTSLTSEEKEQLTGKLSAVIASITSESDIENLVKAKGFADCVVFIDGDKVDVAVKTGGSALDGKGVAQIRDIVLSKADVVAQNITIVEVQ